MAGMGNCCCCPLTLETLPDWQIDGYTVTTDWNNDRLGTGSCCFERTYTAIGNHNAGLVVSPDIVRFWVNEQTRTDAKAISVPIGWVWKGLGAPPGMPPGPLCKQDAGLIGYTTCDYTLEHKRRAYLYYQPWRITLSLSYHIDRCDETEPIRSVYTLSVRTEFKHASGIQTHYRECVRRNFYVTNACYERNTRPDIDSGCESTNLDYATLTPAADFVAWTFGTQSAVTIYQYEELPETLEVDSLITQITEEQWIDCIFEPSANCHANGPGPIPPSQLCWTFDSSNTTDIPDSTPYVQIVGFSQQECAAYGDCTPPTYGYDLVGKVLCSDPGFTTFRINTTDPPLCTQTWNELRPQTTSVPPGGSTSAFCNTQGGNPRPGEVWYQLKTGVTCCTEAIPCPPDGDYDGGPVATDINGNHILPVGYVEGWYGGVYCTEPGKWSVVSYSVTAEYLPITPRTLCIPNTHYTFVTV